MEFAPITFERADDLAYWRAEVPGRVDARAEAQTGPTAPPGKRVQLVNAPGAEVGPGQVKTSQPRLPPPAPGSGRMSVWFRACFWW